MSDITQPKYPNVEVQLIGQDSNGWLIAGKTMQALISGGVDDDEAEEFMREALSGNYDHLLQTVMEWVVVI